MVNSTGDGPDINPGNHYCETGAGNGECTLRAAIGEANIYVGPNTITFDIPPDDLGFNNYWWTISLGSSLPDIIDDDLQILGFTQAANQWDSNPGTVGTGGLVGVGDEPLPTYARPEVAIDGNLNTAFYIGDNTSDILIEGLSLYNTLDGVWLFGGSGTGRTIQYMLIGMPPDAEDPPTERSIGHGIVVQSPGEASITANYIGWNGEDGILGDRDLAGVDASKVTARYNEVFSNGEDLDQGQDVFDGIDLNGVDGVVQYNLIRDNTNFSKFPTHESGAGVELGPIDSGTGGNTIDNNTIIGNLGAGVSIRDGSSLNIVSSNIITVNEVGISVNTDGGSQTNQNKFSQNGIFSNDSGLGIDLHAGVEPDEFDGPTPNDAGDIDTGANDLMNFPVLYSAYVSGSDLVVSGEARPDAWIQFFRSSPDPSGYGEGESFLVEVHEGAVNDTNSNAGSVDPTANAFTFVIAANGTLPGDSLTATARDDSLNMNTSEFSANVTVEPAWFDPDYGFRRNVTVLTGTAAVEAGYSTRLTLDHASLVSGSQSLASGDDVRIAYWDGDSWIELDRVPDPLSAWDNAATKLWFPLVNPIAEDDSDPGYYVYYGNDLAAAPPASWAAAFATGDDFEDGLLTPDLTTSTTVGASVSEAAGVAEIDGGSTDPDAGIILKAGILPADLEFAVQHQAALISANGTGNPEAKVLAVVQASSQPTIAAAAVEDPRRRIVAYQRVDGASYIIYVNASSLPVYWNGSAWSTTSASWGTLALGTPAVYEFVSDGTNWSIVVSNASGTPLTTTTLIAWSSVKDTSENRWLYWGEVYTDQYWAMTRSEWFYLRDYVNPEPSTALAGEVALP